MGGYSHDAMDEDRKGINISRIVKMPEGLWKNKKEIVTQAAYIDTAKMFAYTWNKLYKRNLIEENGLIFSKQVLIEDFIFNTQYWDLINSLCVVDTSGYHYVKASKDALTQKFLPDFLEIMNLRYRFIKELLEKNDSYKSKAKEQLANIYIKHAIAGVARNCSPKGNYSLSEQYKKVKQLLRFSYSKEAISAAKGRSKQEKICNLVFKTRSAVLVLVLGKMIYAMQTKSKTAFDKMK